MKIEITKYGKVNPKNIDTHNLTMSLLSEITRAGVLSDEQISTIQLNLMTMLREHILKFNKKESSSIKKEKAQTILESILYKCDAYLLSLSNIDLAIDILCKENINELCDKGRVILNEYFQKSKLLIHEISKTRVSVSLYSYNDTIDSSFIDFFNYYDLEFDACNNLTMIDYPIMFDDMGYTGVIYIKNYLEHFYLENKFLNYFSSEEIEKLIVIYGKKYKMDTNDVLVNMPEIILKISICSVLLNKSACDFSITMIECEFLSEQFKKLSNDNYNPLIKKAFYKVFDELGINNHAIHYYFRPFIDIFSKELIKSVNENSLSNLITMDN